MVGIIDFGSSKIPNINAIIKNNGYPTTVLKWESCDEAILVNYKQLILSGAPVLLTKIDNSSYLSRFNFLKKGAIPTLGICFGHQLLGLLFGSAVFKGREVRQENAIKIVAPDSLFKGLPDTFSMTEDHTEGITLPKHFKCLAKSDWYEVEAMKHENLPIWGVQFHPEVSGKSGEILLSNFLKQY